MENKHSEIELLYSKWNKVGYAFEAKPYVKAVDLEKLIVDSLDYVRHDVRLLVGIVTWLSKNSDLLNIQRLINLIGSVPISAINSSILGFVLDMVFEINKESSLVSVIKRCKKNSKKDVFFEELKGMKYTEELSILESTKTAKKWGFYCRHIQIRDELVFEREAILKGNKNLAIRSFLGSNLRSEILFYILNKKTAYIQKCADELGFSYMPTYKEFQSLLKNQFLEFIQYGNIKVFSLGKKTERILKTV